MTINWKSLALILTGVLVGCAGNVAQSAYADSSGGGAYKCLGPSATRGGVEEDLNKLVQMGYAPDLFSDMMVCGRR